MQPRAGGLFILVEGVGVDVQRGGGLAVAEDARHRCDIRAARDHQTGGGVPEGVNIQLLRQSVLLEDQLESVGEGRGRHGKPRSLTAEQEVIGGQLPLVIAFGDVCTFLPVLLQSAALAPPHSCGDDELEVGFVLDALALQRGDDLLRRFLVCDLLFALAPSVAVGAPSRIMRKKATLYGIREDAAALADFTGQMQNGYETGGRCYAAGDTAEQ